MLSRTQEHWRSSITLLSLRRGRLGQKASLLASDLHGLDHQAHCWSAWACQNWPPASSRCLQKPVSQGGCKPSGALGSQHCQPPSTWSCGTRTWKRKGKWPSEVVSHSLEEHFQGSSFPATLPHAPQALICSQGRRCFIATSYLLNETQITLSHLFRLDSLLKPPLQLFFL